MVRQKWHDNSHNLQKGDVVLLHEASNVKGWYTLAIVEEVKAGKDDHVRSATVGY